MDSTAVTPPDLREIHGETAKEMGGIVKTCRKCGETKSAAEFRRNPPATSVKEAALPQTTSSAGRSLRGFAATQGRKALLTACGDVSHPGP